MTILSHLLPAIREIRAPLVGGYLLLLFAWLLLGEAVPRSATESDIVVWSLIGRLYDELGTLGLAVTLSVAAYLIGSMVGEAIETFTNRIRMQADRLRDQLSLMEVDTGDDEGPSAELPWRGGSFPLQRLLEPTDRLLSEVEFRVHVALPLMALSLPLRDIGIGATIASILSAMILVIHARLIQHRVQMRVKTASYTIGQASERLQVEQSRRRRARISLSTEKREENELVLKIANVGKVTAKSVTVAGMDGSRIAELPSEFLPIGQLDPGEYLHIPLAVSMGSPPDLEATVKWVDAIGEGSKSARISLRL